MPASIYQPEVEVSIALTAGYTTPAASRVWTDISDYVEAEKLVKIIRGRTNELEKARPSTLSLSLDNRDGRFTPGNLSGAYYPNIKKGRPIRVRVRWPIGSGTWFDRFTGYLDTIPVDWPGGTSNYASVQIGATSRGARLGLEAELRSIVEEEFLQDGPTLYFPMGEPAGSTTVGNIAPGRGDTLSVVTAGTGGNLTFANSIGPGTDDLSTPTFAPSGIANGSWLRGLLTQPLGPSTDHAVVLEAYFVSTVNSITSGTRQHILQLGVEPYWQTPAPAYIPQLLLSIDTSNKLDFTALDGTSIIASKNTVPQIGGDNQLHHVVAVLELTDPASARVKLILDGVDLGYSGSGTWPYSAAGAAFMPTYRYLQVGGNPGTFAGATAFMFSGSLSHVAVYRQATAPVTTTRFLGDHYQAGLNGFTSEGSGARVARYARLAGIPTAEVNVETGVTTAIAHIPTTGKTPAQAMEEVETTEEGLLFDGADGRLTFHARSHRYNAASAFTLDVALAEVDDLKPVLDDQLMSNDVTATRPGGATQRTVNQASIDENGYYKKSLTIYVTTDNEVLARADWLVQRYGTPRVKLPNVGVDLLNNQPDLPALLAADLGTRFTISNQPSQAPASSADYFIEGITETIGPMSYDLELNTSAAEYANVWLLDSATRSQLDSTTILAY